MITVDSFPVRKAIISGAISVGVWTTPKGFQALEVLKGPNRGIQKAIIFLYCLEGKIRWVPNLAEFLRVLSVSNASLGIIYFLHKIFIVSCIMYS